MSVVWRSACAAIICLVSASAAVAQDVAGSPPTAIPFDGEQQGDVVGDGLLPERFALVVGIDHYKSDLLQLPSLTVAAKDASDIWKALEGAHFNIVPLLTDDDKQFFVSRNEIFKALSKLSALASESFTRTGRQPIVLFYFAGHGISYDHRNYIIPSDFSPEVAEDIAEMAISVDELVDRLTWMNPALKVLILDSCRTDLSPGSLQKAANNANRVEVVQIERMSKESERKHSSELNTLLLLQSTLEGEPAKEGSRNGKFTGIFLQEIQKALKTANAEKTGVKSALNRTIYSNVSVALRRYQGSNIVDEAAVPFLLFPTWQDFDDERKTYQSLEATATKIDSEIDKAGGGLKLFYRRLYCRTIAFLQTSSFFSYFSGAALRNLEAADAGMKNDPDAADIDCTDPALQATINPPETLPIIKQVGMWQRQSPATSAPAAAPAATLAPLELRELPSYARFAFLSGLRPDLPVDNLAVSASKAPIFSSTNKIIGSLEKNELVQVIDRARGDRLWIRTASGQEGFTPQRQIVSGRSALTFAVEFAGPGANPDTTPIPIEPLLKTSLLSDLVVEFTERDGTLGLTRAQQLAHRVVTLAQQTLGDKQLLVPSIVAVPIDASPEKQVPAGTIRVIMVVFALEPDIRIQLPQSSGIGKISIDSAIDLSGVIEANKNRPGAPAPEISTDALKATPFVAKRDRCFTAAAAAGPPPEGVATTVNFQIPRADKEPAAERARQALQAAGYATPSIVIAGDQKSLPQTEIRYCRLPANQTAAERAKKILGECDLGEMAIKDAPCSISNTIEIRLGG